MLQDRWPRTSFVQQLGEVVFCFVPDRKKQSLCFFFFFKSGEDPIRKFLFLLQKLMATLTGD
jgi:hypothetical protein